MIASGVRGELEGMQEGECVEGCVHGNGVCVRKGVSVNRALGTSCIMEGMGAPKPVPLSTHLV